MNLLLRHWGLQSGVQAWGDIIIMLFGQITQRACDVEGKEEEVGDQVGGRDKVWVRSSGELI